MGGSFVEVVERKLSARDEQHFDDVARIESFLLCIDKAGRLTQKSAKMRNVTQHFENKILRCGALCENVI